MKKIVLDKHAIKLLAHLGQCTVQDLENIEMELEQSDMVDITYSEPSQL